MENKETILYRNCDIALRSLNEEESESRIVCGYALKFDVRSQNMGFYEIIRKGALTEDTIMSSDIFARLNHNENTVLARSRFGEGSLALELREDGLYYEFESPHFEIGDELLEHLKRGEISTSSFAFSLPGDGSGEKWYRDENGDYIREILHIERLFDVSPVYEPAYLDTTCSKRAMEMLDKAEQLNSKYDALINDLHKYIIE